MARFVNPWKDSDGFVDLGQYDIYEGRNEKKTKYDLYALIRIPNNSNNELFHVSLGARYSDEGCEYISGCLETGWKYGGEKPMCEAARRFTKHLLKKSEWGVS